MIFTNLFQHINASQKGLYFRFWANCILVKGYSKGLVIDLQRSRSVIVSRLFCDIFENHRNHTIDFMDSDKTFENKEGYFKMLDFFIQNDFGILTNDTASLPDLSMEYDSPFWVTNLIFETDSDQAPETMFSVIAKAAKGHVQAIQINDFGHITLGQLKKIAAIVSDSPLQFITIYTFYNRSYSKKQLEFLSINNRFRNLTFMGAPRKRSFENQELKLVSIQYIEDVIDYDNCGNARKDMLVFNQQFFVEAHSRNTCLNRKVCIDKNGDVKNCPLMNKSFGNIMDFSFRQIVELPMFKEFWNLTKDDIDVCKDCEYRYMCMDCRHFIKDKNNIHSQPSKCTYNPYIGKWKDEEGYVPVEECGSYSRETGFIPNHERISMITKKLGV